MSESVDPADMTEEELEARRQKLKDAVEDEAAQLEDTEEAALEALGEATADADETHTVELTGEIEVDVKDSLPGHLEKQAASIQGDDVTSGVDAMIAVMCEIIQTEGYDSEAVWREYHDRYGTTNLMECAMAATDPYWERQKALEDQRQFRGQR